MYRLNSQKSYKAALTCKSSQQQKKNCFIPLFRLLPTLYTIVACSVVPLYDQSSFYFFYKNFNKYLFYTLIDLLISAGAIDDNSTKTSRAEITLKSATLPRRKPAKTEISLDLQTKVFYLRDDFYLCLLLQCLS